MFYLSFPPVDMEDHYNIENLKEPKYQDIELISFLFTIRKAPLRQKFLSLVHCGVLSTENSAWQMVGVQCIFRNGHYSKGKYTGRDFHFKMNTSEIRARITLMV